MFATTAQPTPSYPPAVWKFTLLLVMLTGAFYAGSFRGEFQFDDTEYILSNDALANVWNFREYMSGNTRPLVYFTFAINRAIDGGAIWSYHAVNLLIHIIGGLALFGIIRLTLLTASLRDHCGRAAPWLAMAVATLWSLHPVQTMGVTYIWQRCESLGAMWFLLTIYFFIRACAHGFPTHIITEEDGHREAQKSRSKAKLFVHRGWLVASVLACLCGMGSKETMIGAPIFLLLYDRAVLAGSFRRVLQRRWGVHLIHFATILLLLFLLRNAGKYHENIGVGFSSPYATSIEYTLTMPGVHAHYLRLAVWPEPLVLDYDWLFVRIFPDADRSAVAPGTMYWIPTWKTALRGIVLPGILVLGLLGLSAWAFFRAPAWSLPGTLYILLFGPTSSIMPMPDPVFEYRLYLPLAALLTVLVMGFYTLGQRLFRGDSAGRSLARYYRVGGVVCVLVSLIFGGLTMRRNQAYESDLVLWRDTVQKSPNKWRTHLNYGVALLRAGRYAPAIEQYDATLKLLPTVYPAYADKGVALRSLGRDDEAAESFNQALLVRKETGGLEPMPDAHNNLGEIYFLRGKIKAARYHIEAALTEDANNPRALVNQGQLWLAEENIEAARKCFAEAVQFAPDYALARAYLGSMLLRQKKPAEALAECRAAVRLSPDIFEVRMALGVTLESTGDLPGALAEYIEATRLMPNRPIAPARAEAVRKKIAAAQP